MWLFKKGVPMNKADEVIKEKLTKAEIRMQGMFAINVCQKLFDTGKEDFIEVMNEMVKEGDAAKEQSLKMTFIMKGYCDYLHSKKINGVLDRVGAAVKEALKNEKDIGFEIGSGNQLIEKLLQDLFTS